MLIILRSVFAILLSFGCLYLANGLFNTLLGIRMRLEGFSTQTAGIIMACYFTGLLLSALFAVKVIARVGHMRTFAIFASIISASALLHNMYVDPVFWAGVRLISGFCIGTILIVIESWLNDRSSNAIRGRVFSFYMITTYAGIGLGQFALPLADPQSFFLYSLISIFFSLALIPVLSSNAAVPRPTEPAKFSVIELYRTSPLALVGTLTASMCNASFYSLGPVFAHDLNFSLHQTSYFIAAGVFGGLVSQWPIGKLSDMFDRRKLMVLIACFTLVLSYLIFIFADSGAEKLILFSFFYGACAFVTYSLCVAHANDFTPEEKRVQIASSFLFVYGVGAIAGPLLSSFVMNLYGAASLFVFISIVTAMFLLYSISRLLLGRQARKKKAFVSVAAGHSATKQLLVADQYKPLEQEDEHTEKDVP